MHPVSFAWGKTTVCCWL